MEEAALSLSHMSALLAALDQWSDARRCVSEEAGVPAALIDPGRSLPVTDFLRLYSAVVRLLEERTRRGSSTYRHTQDMSDLLGFAVVGSATLEEAIARVGVFNRSIVTGSSVELQLSGPDARLVFDTHRGADGMASRLVDGSVTMIYHKLLSWLIGKQIPLRSMHAPGLGADGAGPASIVFERSWLRAPVVSTQSDLQRHRGLFPFVLCFDPPARRSATARVRSAFEQAEMRRQPLPGFAALAQTLRIGEQTLRRQLAGEGTSYRALRAEHLCRHAEELLRAPVANVTAVADRLGFSDERAFRRAFRRWTDHAPADFRRAATAEDAAH